MSTFISLAKTAMFASYVPRNAFFAWHDPSYDVIGQIWGGSGSWNFQGGRKKDGRKAIEKMVTIEQLTKKIFQKNRRGGLHQPPPLCWRGLKNKLLFRTSRSGTGSRENEVSEDHWAILYRYPNFRQPRYNYRIHVISIPIPCHLYRTIFFCIYVLINGAPIDSEAPELGGSL